MYFNIMKEVSDITHFTDILCTEQVIVKCFDNENNPIEQNSPVPVSTTTSSQPCLYAKTFVLKTRDTGRRRIGNMIKVFTHHTLYDFI